MKATQIGYDDVDAIKSALVGRRIVKVKTGTRDSFKLDNSWGGDGGLSVIRYTLDDGSKFYASDTDGGCACSNGCFAVTHRGLPENVITDATVSEEYSYGSDRDGSAVIRLFVYSQDASPVNLFSSDGGDNGYYGWGHNLYVKAAR